MKRLLVLAAAVLLLALGAAFSAACGDDEDDDGGEATPTTAAEATPTEGAPSGEIPEVAIGATDYQFEAPATITGGLTRISLTNSSEIELHQAQLFRLNEGVTFDDFTAALPEGEAAIIPLTTAVGGPGAGPGLSNENVLDLEAGTYALLCLIPSPNDGILHAAKGMITTLEVTAPAAEQPEPPVADVSVGLADFAFDIPASLPAGTTTFDVVNNGLQPHEMALFQAAEGATYQDVIDIILAEPDPEAPPPEGPPPFAFAGLMAVLSDGESGFTTIDLSAGTYALLCFVTDPDSGAPHAALGMAQELTVE
jgi:uncharacterized cupredoxin-like copper-binding protein